jgi:hypothetical protein
MTPSTEITGTAYATRHCTEYGCDKCLARIRWARRKKWRTRKNTSRRSTRRK